MTRTVLFLPSWWPSPEAPVAGCFIRHQALALRRECEVAVVVPDVPGSLRAALARIGRNGATVANDEGLRVCRERGAVPALRSPGRHFDLWLGLARRGIRRLLAAGVRPWVLHAHVVLPAGWAAVRLGRELGLRVVLSEYTGPFAAHLASAAGRDRVRETLTHATCILSLSPDLTRQMQAVDPALAPRLVGTLVRTGYFVPASGGGVRNASGFFSLGALTPGKGFAVLVEAARQLRARSVPEFQIEIGGAGPERASLERLASDLGVAGCVRFLGPLSDAEVRARMQSCAAFVSPSLGETFGLVNAEALACGTPVIATRCGGPEFVVPPGGGELVEPGDPTALADALERRLRGDPPFDPAAARESIVARFGPEAFVRRLVEAYAAS